MTSLRTHWATGPLMPLAVPPPVPLPEAIPFRELIGRIPPTRRQRILQDIGDAVADDLDTKMQAAWDSLGFTPAPPHDRLLAYIDKPFPIWQEQEAKFPNDAVADMEDFSRLRQRALKGDFDASDGGHARILSLQWQYAHPQMA